MPTRQYLDPVRYLTNASSGRMGGALAAAAIELGHQVVIVSGPVDITYPAEATVRPVVSTEEMFDVAREQSKNRFFSQGLAEEIAIGWMKTKSDRYPLGEYDPRLPKVRRTFQSSLERNRDQI